MFWLKYTKLGDYMDFKEYYFDNINNKSGYIFQRIKGRRLTDQYHSHNFYEFLVILDGKCTNIINEERIEAPKGEFIILCPGDKHKFIDQSEDVNLISLSVKKEEVEKALALFGLEKENLHFANISLNFKKQQNITQFYNCRNEYDYKFLVATFIKYYIDSFEEDTDIPSNLDYAISQMQRTENLKLGINRFVELSGYSKTHLARLIKKHKNLSLHQFVLNLRLEKAYESLIITNEPIENLSERLGYSSYSHFQKIFKAKYGKTPSALRKEYGSWTT